MKMFAEILKRIADLERRQANVLRIGTVAEVDHSHATVRVKIGKLLTAPLPWFAHRAGANARTWEAPAIGEQVMVLSPSGELVNGVALPAIYQSDYPMPEDTAAAAEIETKIYPDGTQLTYDYGAHKLTADVKGDVEITTTGFVKAEIQGTLAARVHGRVQLITLADATITTALDLKATVGTTASLTAGNSINLTAPNIALNGQIQLNGTITQGAGNSGTTATLIGPVTVVNNVTAAGISLQTHKHGGVETGGGTTAEPQ